MFLPRSACFSSGNVRELKNVIQRAVLVAKGRELTPDLLPARIKDAGESDRNSVEKVLGEPRGWLAALFCIIGLVFLISAGRLIVAGATGIARSYRIDPFVSGNGYCRGYFST